MVAYDIPLRLQITERAVGVERSFGPRADMRPLTIAGNSARAEAVRQEDCVSISRLLKKSGAGFLVFIVLA